MSADNVGRREVHNGQYVLLTIGRLFNFNAVSR
jgi:hypothetical protein